MIAEEVQDVFVERTLLVKQEAVARKNYKVGNWLKLLALHQQNHNQQQIDTIIRTQIHENFIMHEGFWQGEAIKRLQGQLGSQKDIQLLMLGLEDGTYDNLASIIADKVLQMFKNKKLRQNFCLSVFEKMITVFSMNSKVAKFFQGLRQIYSAVGATAKIRDSFVRQMKLVHDNFDLVWDEYKIWESDQSIFKSKEYIYQETKHKWQKASEQFEEKICSETNIKKSLNNLESINESKINEEKYLFWLDKLPTQVQKIWYLRRIALNYRQMFEPYLQRIELLHRNDDDIVIKKYKIAIRLSNNSQSVETKYLQFLARRLNKHLLNEPLPEDYNQIWPTNVGFFRQQISELIQKTRVGISEQESKNIFEKYYQLWIQVEEKIIKDKDSVCQLYENIVKDAFLLQKYVDYAYSLVNFGALKQAKNVLKRYIHHSGDEKSKQAFVNFISLFGTIDDQVQFEKQFKFQNKKQDKNEDEVKQQQIRVEQKPVEANKGDQQSKFKRERTEVKDELDQKILESTRKKLHVDNDATIYLKGIPTTWKETDVLNILTHPQKVARVSLVVKNNDQKDYCYIEYSSKQAAEEEIKNNKSQYKLYISKPPSEYDDSSTLFVCALPQTASEEKLRDLFGKHASSIVDIRLKLSRDKNYAYVEFDSKQQKQSAFEYLKKQPLVIDGKKILVQHCDSNRAKNKKFIPVVFIKNLHFKANEQHLRQFFTGKSVTKILIPWSAEKKSQGFAYVQFEKFKDYQDALDMKKGKILGRQFQIFRSDRQITESHKEHINHPNSQDHSRHQRDDNRHKKNRKQGHSKDKQAETKDNSYFSSLFK